MPEDIVRIVRVLEYIGPRNSIETTLQNGAVPMNGEARHGSLVIRSACLGSFAEIMKRASAPVTSSEADPNHGG